MLQSDLQAAQYKVLSEHSGWMQLQLWVQLTPPLGSLQLPGHP